ncbi:Uncharacterized protein Rs2_47562 [Raphanus sativus]|nr:Uncharacterized protein Rs2_47562 [Raphanus sativus]
MIWVILALLLLIVPRLPTAQSDNKILASDGDTVECVDRNKQLAFKIICYETTKSRKHHQNILLRRRCKRKATGQLPKLKLARQSVSSEQCRYDKKRLLRIIREPPKLAPILRLLPNTRFKSSVERIDIL